MYLFLSLFCDINLSLSNSYKDHRNGYTVHSVTQHVCFSSDRELPQCSVCMKMSVELGLTLYLLRFLPLLALSCATIFLTISSLPALSSSVSRRRTMISPSPLLAVYGYRRLSLLRELRSTSHSFKFRGDRGRGCEVRQCCVTPLSDVVFPVFPLRTSVERMRTPNVLDNLTCGSLMSTDRWTMTAKSVTPDLFRLRHPPIDSRGVITGGGEGE